MPDQLPTMSILHSLHSMAVFSYFVTPNLYIFYCCIHLHSYRYSNKPNLSNQDFKQKRVTFPCPRMETCIQKKTVYRVYWRIGVSWQARHFVTGSKIRQVSTHTRVHSHTQI